jgi:hypothetical protein
MASSVPSKTGNTQAALEFLKKAAEAEVLSVEVQKFDVFNTVRVARAQGYDIGHEDLWVAVTELQKNKANLAANIPSWIIDKLRVALHD